MSEKPAVEDFAIRVAKLLKIGSLLINDSPDGKTPLKQILIK